MLSKMILLLTTTGRKTGKPRYTALENFYNPEAHTFRVMASWGGKTDWYRNAIANPNVYVQVGNRRFDAIARPASEAEVAAIMKEIIRINPGAARMFSRFCDEPLDGSDERYLAAARHFPTLFLHLE